MRYEFQVEGGDFLNAGKASSSIKKVLKTLGVNSKIVKRTVVALYEGEVNIVAHAYRGNILVDIDENKVEIQLIDEGPGIKDIDIAMTEGFSTASEKVMEMGFGAGMGLPNMRNNTEFMEVTSKVGEGTKVIMRNSIQ